jgi:hypothetical protein
MDKVDRLFSHLNDATATRVVAVANVLYARTDVAGAYRWDNANSKWIPITDMFNFTEGGFQGVESIALDPTDANKAYLVGGMYVNSGNARLYKSLNKGATWTYVELPFPAGGNNAGRAIGERLMVDPNKPSIIFYASRSQWLWKSTDSGATWKQVTGLSTSSSNVTSNGVPCYTTDNGATWTATNLPPPTQTTVNSAYHLAADLQNPNKVCAYDSGGARWSNTNGKFYYSTDGGKTFTKSTDATLEGLSFQQFGVTWLAVNPNAEGQFTAPVVLLELDIVDVHSHGGRSERWHATRWRRLAVDADHEGTNGGRAEAPTA